MQDRNANNSQKYKNDSDGLFCIDRKPLVVSGKWLKIASLYKEIWYEKQIVDDPEMFINNLKSSKLNADIFTFSQRIPDWKPKYKYNIMWDNVAAIPITEYQEWWERLSSGMRKDVNRSVKKGVIVKEVKLNEKLIHGIVEINNDTRIRQGKVFPHYGKTFETVRKEYSTYPDNSIFIGAYYQDELVGIVKIVFVGDLACIMEFLSKTKYYDKRPSNAMIAKAVELLEYKNKSYFTYGPYYYGKKTKSTLVDFKRRCGFERILYPRYFIPLSLKGYAAIKLNLQLGLIGILPGNIFSALVYLRSIVYRKGKAGLQGRK